MFFSVYGIISVCACVCVPLCVLDKNEKQKHPRRQNFKSDWYLSKNNMCVGGRRKKMAENSGRWLLMIKQWQHKCLEFWRSIFHLQLHSIQLKDASDVNKTPLLLNTLPTEIKGAGAGFLAFQKVCNTLTASAHVVSHSYQLLSISGTTSYS